MENSRVHFVITGLNDHLCLLNVFFLLLQLISDDGNEGGEGFGVRECSPSPTRLYPVWAEFLLAGLS